MIEQKYLLQYNGMTFVDITKFNELQSEIKHLLELQEVMDKEYDEMLEKNERLKQENFNLREDIMIKKMSFPNKEIKDKTFFDLYDMPTYEELKNVINEIRKYITQLPYNDLIPIEVKVIKEIIDKGEFKND